MALLAFMGQIHSLKKQVIGFQRGKETYPSGNPTKGNYKGRHKGSHKEVQEKGEVQEEEEEEEEEEEKDKEEIIVKSTTFSFYKSLISIGAESKLANEWLAVRKKKKATDTETAFDGFVREMNKCGLDINSALRICIEKSWSGFNASWLKGLEIQTQAVEGETEEENIIKKNFDSEFYQEDLKAWKKGDLNPIDPLSEEKEKSCAKKENTNPLDLDTLLNYGREIYQNELKLDFSIFEFAVRSKYQTWIDAGWKDGHKKPIIGWQNKIRNTIPHLKPIYGKFNSKSTNAVFSNQKGNSNGNSKVSGKVSASSILARQAREQFTRNGDSGDSTIEVEVV